VKNPFLALFSKHPNLTHTLPIYFLCSGLPFAAIVILRVTGLIPTFEGLAFDTFLRLRPIEAPDNRVVIVGIDDEDLKYLKERDELVVESISDLALAETISKIAAQRPAAIGLDIIRDAPIGKGRAELERVTRSYQNIVELYKVTQPDPSPPALKLPLNQVGFIDGIVDSDGRERRAHFVISAEPDNAYSLPFQLGRLYLERHKLQISKVTDRQIEFGNGRVLNGLIPAPGKYDATEIDGFQTIINYRNHPQPFKRIALRDILTGKDRGESLKDRVVLIGYTATSRGDFSYTNALPVDSVTSKTNPAQIPNIIYGVESHAHVTSQLISYALDNRHNLMLIDRYWDFIWLVSCVVVGLALPELLRRTFGIKSTPLLLISSTIIYLFSIILTMYLLILVGIWVPIAATFITFIISAPLFATLLERERQLDTIAKDRLMTIEIAFEEIHAAPLQTIYNYQKNEHLAPEVREMLAQIRHEIDLVNVKLKKEYSHEEELRSPLGEILAVAFERQIEQIKSEKLPSANAPRNLHGLSSANYLVDFDEIQDNNLTSDNKRQIRSFLEEALRNINKYATGVTRVDILSRTDNEYCYLEISDNGKVTPDLNRRNQGTRDAEKTARSLQGRFIREAVKPNGCKCTLSWKCIDYSLSEYKNGSHLE
jgi:CHASE2 domain-containing sensor protein